MKKNVPPKTAFSLIMCMLFGLIGLTCTSCSKSAETDFVEEQDFKGDGIFGHLPKLVAEGVFAIASHNEELCQLEINTGRTQEDIEKMTKTVLGNLSSEYETESKRLTEQGASKIKIENRSGRKVKAITKVEYTGGMGLERCNFSVRLLVELENQQPTDEVFAMIADKEGNVLGVDKARVYPAVTTGSWLYQTKGNSELWLEFSGGYKLGTEVRRPKNKVRWMKKYDEADKLIVIDQATYKEMERKIK